MADKNNIAKKLGRGAGIIARSFLPAGVLAPKHQLSNNRGKAPKKYPPLNVSHESQTDADGNVMTRRKDGDVFLSNVTSDYDETDGGPRKWDPLGGLAKDFKSAMGGAKKWVGEQVEAHNNSKATTKSFAEMMDEQGGPTAPEDFSAGDDIAEVNDFGSNDAQVAVEMNELDRKMPSNDEPANPEDNWRHGASLMQKTGKSSVPETVAHKMGVAVRRARRMGINPNNMQALGMLMDGREKDGGIRSHGARKMIDTFSEGEIDRESSDEGANQPNGGGLIPEQYGDGSQPLNIQPSELENAVDQIGAAKEEFEKQAWLKERQRRGLMTGDLDRTMEYNTTPNDGLRTGGQLRRSYSTWETQRVGGNKGRAR